MIIQAQLNFLEERKNTVDGSEHCKSAWTLSKVCGHCWKGVDTVHHVRSALKMCEHTKTSIQDMCGQCRTVVTKD